MVKQKPIKAPEPQADPTPEPQDTLFDDLWNRFIEESHFSTDALELEMGAVREEIEKLEALLAAKRNDLDEIEHREDHAKETLRTLLGARLSPDAILSAMRVEFRVKRPAAPRKDPDVGDDIKSTVLELLDREGQTITDIARSSGMDSKLLTKVLTALAAEGKVATQGERRARIYMIV